MSDYDRIARAIAFIADRVNDQPTLDDIAAHLHMSPFHFQRLFCRWAGVSPKRFLQVLTLERSKSLLSEPRSLLEVSDSLGLSSGSRLYDHFVQIESVTPGEYKKKGRDVTIEYGVHATPFGPIFVAITARGVCRAAFLEFTGMDEQLAVLNNAFRRSSFPKSLKNRAESNVFYRHGMDCIAIGDFTGAEREFSRET